MFKDYKNIFKVIIEIVYTIIKCLKEYYECEVKKDNNNKQ
ncbi:protein of unknown function [Methanocaldococcus lauensis]|uniref:Uncharacterized protein n=1 Tax=Methanocaldococcus lauensis TaxID=2546128 RepID=A0A8D6Q1W5_9EURY|nr:protein of unknown function [Methanocaldococcus lauensis]